MMLWRNRAESPHFSLHININICGLYVCCLLLLMRHSIFRQTTYQIISLIRNWFFICLHINSFNFLRQIRITSFRSWSILFEYVCMGCCCLFLNFSVESSEPWKYIYSVGREGGVCQFRYIQNRYICSGVYLIPYMLYIDIVDK